VVPSAGREPGFVECAHHRLARGAEGEMGLVDPGPRALDPVRGNQAPDPQIGDRLSGALAEHEGAFAIVGGGQIQRRRYRVVEAPRFGEIGDDNAGVIEHVARTCRPARRSPA